MQAFQISTGPPVGQKNYVFVDEHNRHKRLKVMRACEGCRRRKIKCDSATTNIWPCSACTRLKLACVPPATGNEDDSGDGDATEDFDYTSESYGHPSAITDTEDVKPFISPQSPLDTYSGHQGVQPYIEHQAYSKPYLDHEGFQSNSFQPFDNPSVTSVSGADIQASYGQRQASTSIHRVDTNTTDQSNADDLTDQLGDLAIGENGIARYARQWAQNETDPDAPIQEEDDIKQLRTTAGSQIRIPPELLPQEEDAIHAFNTFFREIHPYLPVLNRSSFYQQWHTDRSTISPLLLEAVFACAGKVTDHPGDGSQWLSLANGSAVPPLLYPS